MDAKRHPAHYVGASNQDRAEGDFYKSPPEATYGLLWWLKQNPELYQMPDPIWEPACGDGGIALILEDFGYTVIGTDKYDRGYGQGDFDFFDLISNPFPDHFPISNPPYETKTRSIKFVVEDWIEKFYLWDVSRFALLLKTVALAGKTKRARLHKAAGLKYLLQFEGRITTMKNGDPTTSTGMIDFAWYLYDRDYTGLPQIDWIPNDLTLLDVDQLPLFEL